MTPRDSGPGGNISRATDTGAAQWSTPIGRHPVFTVRGIDTAALSRGRGESWMSQDSSRPSTQPRPTGTPRAVSEHRELLLGGARGFPWTLVLGALVTTLVIILSFKLASLLPTFALNPELLWLLKRRFHS